MVINSQATVVERSQEQFCLASKAAYHTKFVGSEWLVILQHQPGSPGVVPDGMAIITVRGVLETHFGPRPDKEPLIELLWSGEQRDLWT
jgi:hypothetical protein